MVTDDGVDQFHNWIIKEPKFELLPIIFPFAFYFLHYFDTVRIYVP